MIIHLIHGIHKSEGSISTPEYLLPELRHNGHSVIVHEYGYVLAITTRFLNPGRARKIALSIDYGDVIIAHSNGCDLVRIMINDLGVSPSKVIFLQPALDKDTSFCKWNFTIDVLWNEKDKAVFFAKLLLFHHPFGEMGRTGYTGSDNRITNHNTIGICGVGGHSSPYQKSVELRKFVVSLLQMPD